MKLNKKGFTLVELLAVIVILALLMVVAGRAIGTSLTDSKRKALETETQKVLTKVYEEAKTQTLTGNLTNSSKFSNGTYDFSNNVVTVTEGDYVIYIKLSSKSDDVKITDYCATDKNGRSVGQKLSNDTPMLSFASDFWDEAANAVTADTAVTTTMKRGSDCVHTTGTIKIKK